MVDKVNNGKPTGLSLDVSFPNGETKNYTFGEAALAGIDYTDITGNSGKQYYHYKDSSGADKYTTDITNLPASISINEETGNIKIAAPKSITDSDMFKQVFDEDTLKQYSQAYKLNPEYKISVREKNEETGEEEDKEITIPEYVQRLNSSIENYMKNLRDIHAFRDILREKYGDKADNMSDEIVQIAKMNGGKALYVPDSILNVSSFGNVPNPFKELKSKMTDDGLVSTEEFSKIWIRNNFGRDEIAAILAHIDGHLRQSDWSEDETYTDYDGITHNNRNSATEAAKLIAFRNYITSNNPTATNFQQMGDYIESLTYNAAQQTTKIFGDLAGTAQWVFSGNNDSSILDYVQEMDEAMEYFNEDNILVWDAITNAQIWGSLGGMALGTWGAAKLLSVPFKLAGKVSSAFTSRYLNVASHIGELVENGSKISLGAQMAFKAMTVAEKVNLGINMAATGISNAVGGSFFLQFVFDTMHDAILYDANGFKDMMVKMSEQSEFDQKAGVALQYWGEQFADNTKWWAPMGAGRALIKTAGKTALGKATNIVLTKYINKVESAIGTKFQGWQDDLGSGTVISRLQEKIDKAKNQGKKAKVQRLETKKQIEEQLVDIRRARAQIGDVKLDWDGVKLTEESAKEWANAMTRLKAVENGIDNYIRGVEAKTREMFTAIKDPATGKPMFLFEELAGANIKASKWYYKLVDLSSKHGLSVAKNSLLNQDVIDYWMGSYKRDIYKAFADSGTENGAKAEKALETINNNLEILKSRLPEDITKYIDDGIKNKVYQDFYRQLNKYGVENKLLVKDTIDSYESNPIWVENGYMPIAHDVDPGGRWIREDDKIEAIIEQEMDKLKFGAKEGEHFRDPELVRQVRSRHMAQASVNKDLWKSYSGWGSNATNITVVSGEETEFARKIQESQKALKNEISKQASAAFEQKILGEFTITKKKPIKNENLSIETRGEIVSDMSPSEVSEYLSNRTVNGKKVINGSQGTIVQTVTPENYDEWYGSQSKQVRNYLWSKKQGVSEDNPYAGWAEGELNYEKGTITDKMSKKRTAIFYNEKDGVDYVGNSKRTGDSIFIEENLEQSDSVPVDTNGKNIFGGTEAKGNAYKTKNNVVLYETVDLEDASAFGKKTKGVYKDSPGTHASTSPDKTDVKDGYTRYILRKHVQKGTDVFVLSKKTKDGKFLLPESDKGVFIRTGELDANGNEIVDVYIGVSAKDSRLKNIVPKPKEEIDIEESAKAERELIKEVFGEEDALLLKDGLDTTAPDKKYILSSGKKFSNPDGYRLFAKENLTPRDNAGSFEELMVLDQIRPGGNVDWYNGMIRSGNFGDADSTKLMVATIEQNFGDGTIDSGVAKELGVYDEYEFFDLMQETQIDDAKLEDLVKNGNYTLNTPTTLYKAISSGGNKINRAGDLGWLNKKIYSDDSYQFVSLDEAAVSKYFGEGDKYLLRYHLPKGQGLFYFDRIGRGGNDGGAFVIPPVKNATLVRSGAIDDNGAEYIDVFFPGTKVPSVALKPTDPEIVESPYYKDMIARTKGGSLGKEYSDKILSEYEAERQAYAAEGEKRLAQIEEAREASRVTYKDFKEMSEQGGVDFEEELQRAWVLGDPDFAKSSMANEAARNLAAGKDAFYQGTFLAKAKGKLKNIKKVDGDDFVDDMAASTQIMVDRFVEQVLAAPGAKDVIKALAGTSDGAGDVARFYALQELLKPENFKKASSAIDEQIELMRKKLGLNADDVDLLKDTAKDILKDTVKSESDSARLAAKTLNAELTDAKALSDEVKEINDRIKAADKRLGEDYVMYLDDNGRKVYAKVDPAFASLFSYRYRMEKVDASVFARINGFMSRMYRYGTTSVNLSSFGNQLFRDFGNAILVGGAWQTIKANADNLVSVFGQNIVDQIKRFEPEEMARIEKISDETGRTLEDIAVSRELIRGAAKAPSSTERTLYKTFMKEAYGNPNTVLEKMQTRLQKIVDKWNPEELLNGKRENYLRNRVYASSLNDAMKQGYTLEQSRVFAEFAMNNATTNFTRQLYHMQAIADSTPYFRAAINGTKSFWRMWSVDPVGITGRIVGGLILPTMYLTGASLGDEESRKIYMNMPEYMKEDSMVFVFNGQAVSIPIPQELGQIVAPFRHFVEYLSNNAQKNDFWELMMNDLLGYSPIDLKGFTSIDMDKMISDPTIFDRIGRGMARTFSQMAPVPIKSAYMLATGTDPYSGKSLRDSSYMYWNDETNSVEVMDYNQNAFATWFAKLFGGWMSPELAEKVVSGTVGSTGSNLLGGFTKLLQEGPEAGAKDLGDKFTAQAKNPFDVNEYNYTDSVWRRAIRQLTSEKEAILNSEEMKVINNKLAQTKDPDVRKKVLAERQDIVDKFHQRVGDTINRLSSVYNGTFDRQKFAAVINLLNFNSDSAYQSGSQYSSNISSELFWDGQDAAIHTMERLGVTGTSDTSIFGYLATDKDGNPIVKYTSPVAIMDMDRQWGNQDDIHAANIKALVSQNDLYDAHKAITKQIQSIYDSKDKLTSQDKANIEAIQINWNAQLAKTIAPYVATMTPEAAINNTEVLNALYPYVEVPGSWEVNDKGKGVYLGNRGNKKKAYYESWIKSMFGVNDPYKGQY